MSSDEQFVLASLKEAIIDSRVVLIGPIRQEVLSGIKESVQFEKLRTSLAAFPDETLTTQDYEAGARLFDVCRGCGVECGSIDILICAVATRLQYSILTYDQGLKRCMQLLRTEGLMP